MFPVVALLTAVSLIAGYTKVEQFNRFFLCQCAEDGPKPEEALDISLQPVDLANYADRLREAASDLSLHVGLGYSSA